MIAKKYLEYVLSAKTMNSRSYSPPPSHLCDPWCAGSTLLWWYWTWERGRTSVGARCECHPKGHTEKKEKGITWYYSFDDVVNLFTLVRLSVVIGIWDFVVTCVKFVSNLLFICFAVRALRPNWHWRLWYVDLRVWVSLGYNLARIGIASEAGIG